MTIKSILLPFSGEDKELSALHVAFSLARNYNAHVTCLHISPDPNTMIHQGVSLSPSTIESILEDLDQTSQDRSDNAKRKFEALRKSYSIDTATAQYINMSGNPQKIIATEGKFYDAIVAGRSIVTADIEYHTIISSAIFETTKPVILAPNEKITEAGHTITIAWNGSKESIRAVNSALPLLSKAQDVHLLTIENNHEKEELASLEKLSAYLQLHNVKAKTHLVKKHKNGTAKTLLEKSEELGADLLVMGAYTHNRIQQAIFGGVTTHMLDEAKICVLMAH